MSKGIESRTFLWSSASFKIIKIGILLSLVRPFEINRKVEKLVMFRFQWLVFLAEKTCLVFQLFPFFRKEKKETYYGTYVVQDFSRGYVQKQRSIFLYSVRMWSCKKTKKGKVSWMFPNIHSMGEKKKRLKDFSWNIPHSIIVFY